MVEVFENKFHKSYVGGEGEVAENQPKELIESKNKVKSTTLEEVLAEYRKYVGDPEAQLPEGIMKIYLAIQRTENDRST